ncbi:MAG: hypothetical protein KAI66_27425, partial [Lentisphaeria bacterium]|nr:hypothetical protein [Lentisphaeria bacterium]
SVARLRDQVGLKKKTRVQADIVFDDLVERLLRIAEEAPDMGRANRAWLACRRLVQKVCPGPSGMRRSHYLALLKGLLKGKYEPDWRLVEDVAHYCKPRTDEEGAEYFALLESARASHRRYTGTDEGWSGCRLAERAARERIRLCAERLAAKGSVQAVGKVPWAKATCAFRFHRQRGVRINVGHIMLVNEKVGYVLVNRTIGSAKSQTMHFLRFYHTPGSGMREVFRYKLPPTLSSHGAMGVHPRLLLSSSGTLFAASDKLIVVPAQGGGVRVLDEEDGLPVAQCLPMACMGQLLLLETLGWGRAGAKGQLRYTMTYDLESGQLKTIVNPTENRPDLPASARRGVPAGGYWKADEEARCFVRVDPMRLQSLRYNVDRGTWKTVRIRPPWADSPELSRQPFQVRRRMFIQQLRKKRPSYSQRCIVDSWHWQRHPFSRVHQTTKRRELFPKVVAGLSTENVFSIGRQGDLVYVLTQSGLLRLH